ncbi:MAG: hypothetical protein RSE24_05275, partial [Oscillospiraceae bacterium]
MNKRLIFSSLNILYDKLAQAGNKELTTKVSDYLSLAVYKMFRMLYTSNRSNSQSMFEVNANIFEGYSTSAQVKTCADLNALLSDKQIIKNSVGCFGYYKQITTPNVLPTYNENPQTGCLRILFCFEILFANFLFRHLGRVNCLFNRCFIRCGVTKIIKLIKVNKADITLATVYWQQ